MNIPFIIILAVLFQISLQDKPEKWFEEITTQKNYHINHGPDSDDRKRVWVEIEVENPGWFSFQVRQGSTQARVSDLFLFYLTFQFKDDRVIAYEYDNDFISYNERMVEVGPQSNIIIKKAEYNNGKWYILFKRDLAPTEAYISVCGQLHYSIKYDETSMKLPEKKDYEVAKQNEGKINFDKNNYKCINKILTLPEAIRTSSYSNIRNAFIGLIGLLLIIISM